MIRLEDKEQGLYDSLLMEYACGALDEPLSMLLAAHLTLSPRARRRVALYECMGGVLIEKGCTPVSMKEESLSAVLGQLDCPDAASRCNPPASVAAMPEGTSLPQPLCQFFGPDSAGSSRWRMLAPGVRFMRVAISSDKQQAQTTTLRLYRMKPGAKPPQRKSEPPSSGPEACYEYMLVLEGALVEEGAERYHQGALVVSESWQMKTVQACPDEGCTCLVVGGGRHKGLPGLLERLFG